MENKKERPTLRDLAVIFAGYMGQEFTVKDEVTDVKKRIYGVDPGWVYFGTSHKESGRYAPFCTVLVKSLSEISQEHADEVAGLVCTTGQWVKEQISKGFLWHLQPVMFDVLRERGYAMPYKKWSVRELEAFGIYKLIQPCQHEYVTNVPNEPSTCRKCGHRWGVDK